MGMELLSSLEAIDEYLSCAADKPLVLSPVNIDDTSYCHSTELAVMSQYC